jgi:hypothetical protein
MYIRRDDVRSAFDSSRRTPSTLAASTATFSSVRRPFWLDLRLAGLSLTTAHVAVPCTSRRGCHIHTGEVEPFDLAVLVLKDQQ